MGATSGIEWTDATWPVVKGCSYVSPGCANCYAVDLIHRHSHNPNPKISLPLAGLTEARNGRPRWTGKVYLNEPHLTDPLTWRKGRMIFVPSHGDLFHEDVPDEFIDRVFAVMALAGQHTFQVLTKRPERMEAYFTERLMETREEMVASFAQHIGKVVYDPRGSNLDNYGTVPGITAAGVANRRVWPGWPLPNVWLGTSVENQAAADDRIPHLLRTPAAVRFLSCEPLLSAVDLRLGKSEGVPTEAEPCRERAGLLHWCIVGGESGPGARPFDLEWARSIVTQCKAAGVACFVKQLGSQPHDVRDGSDRPNAGTLVDLLDRKGADYDEFPADLQVREFPTPTGG